MKQRLLDEELLIEKLHNTYNKGQEHLGRWPQDCGSYNDVFKGFDRDKELPQNLAKRFVA